MFVSRSRDSQPRPPAITVVLQSATPTLRNKSKKCVPIRHGEVRFRNPTPRADWGRLPISKYHNLKPRLQQKKCERTSERKKINRRERGSLDEGPREHSRLPRPPTDEGRYVGRRHCTGKTGWTLRSLEKESAEIGVSSFMSPK